MATGTCYVVVRRLTPLRGQAAKGLKAGADRHMVKYRLLQ